MISALPDSIRNALENIYISPLETCNLNCKICYTNKTATILTNRQILSFIRRYRQRIDLKSVLFCGGEVFTLKNFPRLVNRLLSDHIFVSIITNGTIDRLQNIKDPQNCQLLVSFDGPQDIHDRNRGSDNFDKSNQFIARALKLGFPVGIMYLVSPESYPFIDSFNLFDLKLNFITQKTYFYTVNHPLSNQNHTTPALTPTQIIHLKTRYPSLPPKNFGCFQLSLQSDGQIYGCCESPYPLAKISDKISIIVNKFRQSLTPCSNCQLSDKQFFSAQRMRSAAAESPKVASTTKIVLTDNICLGCCAPDFLCGYKNELGVKSCQQVVKKFNEFI